EQPSDPAEWLDKLEKLLPKELAKLPEGLRDDFSALMAYQIRHARHCLATQATEDMHTAIVVLSRNYRRIISNSDKLVRIKYSKAQSDKAKQALLERWGGDT